MTHALPGAPTPTVAVAQRAGLISAALAGGAVSVAIGVYGRVHHPTGRAITSLGFPSLLSMKAWLATAVIALAVFQVVSASWLYGRLPLGDPPAWLGTVHRWSGTTAFLTSLPVAYHCLWSLGFQATSARVLIHSMLGCALYGAIATKLLVLRLDDAPVWVLPVAGGLVATVLVGLWLTSALWLFTTVGFPAL